MARIRTIKPDFPHSESMGRVSRDARLLFVMLWTIADDAGRLRGNSRMLASLLFPYDDDAGSLIGGWLDELEREGCIARYSVDGGAYVEIRNWLNHQKIDKPSASKIPANPGDSENPREDSRILPVGRERKGKEGRGEDASEKPVADAPTPVGRKAKKLTLSDWLENIPEGQQAVPPDDTIFDWADQVGLPSEYLALAWESFGVKYADNAKTYTDWRAVFRTAVRENWLKLWYIRDGQYLLTTVGEQARRAAA